MDINTSTQSTSWLPAPELKDTIVKDDSIELIYKETPYAGPRPSVFKIVYSCKDGKWHQSEKIYGQIIPAAKEKYKFEEL